MLKLIVTDMDGTLLNSNREISPGNAAALMAAQRQGVEIAIATGRIYENARGLCQRAGFNPHIISNHGAFAYTKDGEQLLGVGIDKSHVKNAITWLTDNHYFYNLCTDRHSYIPASTADILSNDFHAAKSLIPDVTAGRVQQVIQIYQKMDGRTLIDKLDDLLEQGLAFGSITSITFDQEKLRRGREYFGAYPGLALSIAGRDIFELINPTVSKGKALEKLTNHLHLPMNEVMAIGDNYNDISMLERVGISVAIGNAEEDVKKICKHVSLSNDQNGVAHIINKLLKL
ncbi:Cof-type HAD-IIB family hydrolase [Acetonema longum]|uniref:HAD superfamily hydrolase n=1 Tax=Acetonema longum DSM 6540 TaxID=1009370 RepID=F7NN95_9FIRM|nr:Cof-type HAD-IIB family hydrolase [Acetonema longum]EGO62480.1 HAD superfamily hydrolase [Acetonema longum DSM 6540]